MIVAWLGGARRLDAALTRKFGRPYHALLGVGLVIEIVRRVHEAGELRSASGIGAILAVALFALLLLHQLAELGEHMDRRRRAEP